MEYRRMGNMELDWGNTTASHHLKDLWRSPRWTVIRIQALALVAIILSFLVANFGSCRRWSTHWFIQKGFFAAHVLSLSLGTYSIGLMQSSSVKSEMYPIWTVSLFTLFGCIDPVTDYIGLDYKGPLSKVVYGICLNFGYVLLMTISTISSAIGNTAIGMLSAITFIKGFHRSFALMQQRRIRNKVLHSRCLDATFVVDEVLSYGQWGAASEKITLVEIEWVLEKIEGVHRCELRSCYDVCVAYALSHQLQRYFHGERDAVTDPEVLKSIIKKFGGYEWFLEVIETELAFMYEVFFTGNPFLHYYQAKAASFWALASFMGICFVGVATAIPGTMSSQGSGSNKVVDTTTADIAITFGILVSLALLQLLQLIRCWTSNWAKVAVACECARQSSKEDPGCWWPWWMWMRLKTFVGSSNWFDKYLWQDSRDYSCFHKRYLWQDQIGQSSMVRDVVKVLVPPSCVTIRLFMRWWKRRCLPLLECLSLTPWTGRMRYKLYRLGGSFAKMLGLDYIRELLWDSLGTGTLKTTTVRLEDDVKKSIIKFLGRIKGNIIEGSWFFSNYPSINEFLPYYKDPKGGSESRGRIYARCVAIWYTATRYCQLVEEKTRKRAGAEQNANRRVAIAMSKYCAYLLHKAPELLPGLARETTHTYHTLVYELNTAFHTMSSRDSEEFRNGVHLATLLLGVPTDQWPLLRDAAPGSDPWETLAQVWVRLLIYAAPYGDVEVHKHRLAQGGEFITHLWALLYHLDIREWKHPEEEDVHDIIRQKIEKKNLQNIITMDDAKRITMDDLTVVAFVGSLPGPHGDELATASNLEDGVRFYQTSSPDVAKHFHIDPEAGDPALVLLNKVAKENFTIYDGRFRAYDIAYFVTSNKLAFAKTRAQGTAPSSVDNPIKNQSLEDGGQTEDEITKESSGDGGHGHTEDEIVEEEISPLS